MKKIVISILYFGLLGLSTSIALMPSDHFIVSEKGHTIDFKSKDPSGTFDQIKGEFDFDENNVSSSKFYFKIDVNSINTGNGMMNKKSQTEEWFDAKKYPDIKFKSTKVEKKENELLITGELTIKGITKTYTIPTSYSKSGDKISLKGKFKVNRIEFKVGKKSEAVPDFMNISFVVPADKK
ncbi:MAG: YceI family protein [Bacteroidetes bacterium]|nr:YceI family protein [Bacteroidota bacterium]